MTKDDCYELGKVVKTHGLKGELSIYLDVDVPDEYEELDSLLIERDGQLVPYFIADLNLQGHRAIVKLEEVVGIDAASELVGCKIWLTLDNLPELDDDQFYYHEIVGYQVIDEEKGPLGTVASVASLPHQDLLMMEYQGHEVLIPITNDIVLSHDAEAKTLTVRLPEGLLDVYLSE